MITSLDQVTEQRVTWPEWKPRAAQRRDSPFRAPEVASEVKRIEAELETWGIRMFIISRNNQRIYAGDPAAAVWWTDKTKALRVLACDKWMTVAANLHAIRLTLEAMRALERWGAYSAEQAAEGAAMKALPPPQPVGRPWWQVIPKVERGWPLPAIEGMYREASKAASSMNSVEYMKDLNIAIEAARHEKMSGQ